MGICFSHMKNDQDGSKNYKPRHVYTNPEDFDVCPITALFEYMCVNPDIIQNPDGPLFPGANQEDRF